MSIIIINFISINKENNYIMKNKKILQNLYIIFNKRFVSVKEILAKIRNRTNL